jgi:hypothetical protein
VARERVEWVLDYLLFEREDPPAGVLSWTAIEELETAVAAEPPIVNDPDPLPEPEIVAKDGAE